MITWHYIGLSQQNVCYTYCIWHWIVLLGASSTCLTYIWTK